MNYAKAIQSIAKRNIDKSYDVGDHILFGFSIDLDALCGHAYELETIVQVNVVDKSNSPSIYFLPYYWTNKERGYCDHDDFSWCDLDEDEQKKVYEVFKETFEPNHEETPSLSAYVKANLSLEDKVKLIGYYEEDRGSDGENIYDLDNEEDAKCWIELYGILNLYKCRAEGRFWMGGWQFTMNEENTKNTKAFCLTESECNKMLTDANIIGEIADRYEGYIKDNKKYSSNEETIKWVSEIYHGLIDFEKYAIAKGDIVEYKAFGWIAKSDDGCFEDSAKQGFPTREQAYNDMRNHALEKMKWNTEFTDVCDGQGECGDSTIGYAVHFAPTFIEHSSYSGTYRYKIVKCDKLGKTSVEEWKTLDNIVPIKPM